MSNILYFIGNVLVSIFQYSIFAGLLLLLFYVIFNAYSNSRNFYTAPRYIRTFVFSAIEFSQKWGTGCIIFFILARMMISLISLFFS